MLHNEQETEHHSDIHAKDWFGPAIASMARLNQIQTNVHNMGFHSASSLKVSRSVKRRTKPPLPTNAVSQHNNNNNTAPAENCEESAFQPLVVSEKQKDAPVNYTALESTPPLSTASYQRSAWGSNHSIPELVAQQGKKMTRLRPSSAKGQTSKLRQPPRGRPQSAKEPLCSNQSENVERNIAVCGQKKNLSSTRPPSRGSVPSPIVTTPTGGAWAGLPPGHVTQPEQEARGGVSTVPMVPPSSPVPGDEFGEEEIIYSCPQTPPLLRRPLPQPIHLSLPSVSDSADANRDGWQPTQDDMDTQRLLIQADLFVDQQKIKEKEQDDPIKTLVSRNTTLPDHTDMYLDDNNMHSNGKHDTAGPGGEVESKGIRINVSDKNQPTTKSNFHSRNKQKLSMFLTPDGNLDHSYQPLTLIEESKNERTRIKSAPPRSDKESIHVGSKMGVKIREDRNITVDITPRNVGRKVSDADGFNQHERQNRTNNLVKKQDAQWSHKRMDKNLVSMVNVEYQTDDAVDCNVGSGKPKGRRIKSMNEVETMVSQLSKLSAADDDVLSTNEPDILLMSQVLRKSEGERNYYEMSRSHSRQSVLSTTCDNDKNDDKDASVVYKTTKTIEFNEDITRENSTKLAINSHLTGDKPKTSVKQKPTKHSPTLLPSTIKHQKTNENQPKCNTSFGKNNSEKGIGTKEEDKTTIDELTTMLNEAKTMAVSSLYDASRRPPSGKKTSQRPSSGSSVNKPKARPSTAGPKLYSTTDQCKEKKTNTEKSTKSYSNYATRTGSSNCCRHTKSAKPSKPVVINSVKQTIPMETPEWDHCRKVQSRMAELGVDVDPQVLEKALFAPAGESLYYEVPGNLPKNPTEGLLSHYKYWLSEDYKRIQTMEKRLAQDDHLRYLEKLAAEKKAKKAAVKELKGKKKKKRKLERSNSVA